MGSEAPLAQPSDQEKRPMLYEITNPSDTYTMKVDDFEVAAVAVLLLGEGWYGLEPCEDAGKKVPILALGGADEWFKAEFGRTLGDVVDKVTGERRAALIEAWRSVVIGSVNEREIYETTMAALDTEDKRTVFAAKWHDGKRSSMNDIGARAKRCADAYAKSKAA